MLLKIQLGQETRQTAKSACAHMFIDLYYKHFSRQATSNPDRGTRLSVKNAVLQTESVDSAQHSHSPQEMNYDYVNVSAYLSGPAVHSNFRKIVRRALDGPQHRLAFRDYVGYGNSLGLNLNPVRVVFW